jgi:hypothetical protein
MMAGMHGEVAAERPADLSVPSRDCHTTDAMLILHSYYYAKNPNYRVLRAIMLNAPKLARP